MITKVKAIHNPNTTEALKHLEEMYNNAKTALVEGRSMIIIQTTDAGEQYFNQSLFNEVNNDTIQAYNNYSDKLNLKILRF